MSLKVIGAGVGRTGTYSLKLALNELGLGPCHHMEEVAHNMAVQIPLWMDAVSGKPNWQAIYQGYQSAVDWPTAGFFRELHAAYPKAKFVLTHRSPESWTMSFSETIYKLLGMKNDVPDGMHAWLDMATRVIEKTGFPEGLDLTALQRAFVAHNEAVKASIPAEQLLVFDVKQGWGPLCVFLDAPPPASPFPRSNDRTEFWDLVSPKT